VVQLFRHLLRSKFASGFVIFAFDELCAISISY
jgi:hypothetical protein